MEHISGTASRRRCVAGIAEQARADFPSVSKSARTIGKNQYDEAASGEGAIAFTRRAILSWDL